MKKRLWIVFLSLSLFFLFAVTWIGAQPKEVVLGAIYPMTGPTALGGEVAKFAIETAVDIINNKHDLDVPLARTEGLPRLGGAKVRVIILDHQGSPEKGLSAAEKLIQDKVAAIMGTYYSSVAAVVSQLCERSQIPFISLEASSPTLHRRGFKWFFRPGPHDELFSNAMFEFMNDLQKKKGLKLQKIALLHEDTLFGTDSANAQTKFAQEFGYTIVADVKYRAKATSMVSEVQKLKSASPDVLLGTSYTSDAILILKTMKELNYMPKILIGQNAGWSDPEFIREMGKDAEGIASRNVFAIDLTEKKPSIKAVNELYRKRANRDLTDNTARELMGTLVMADAINRAGSTDPEAIRKALVETDIKPEQIIMPWKGIKFGPDGQNIYANPIMTQWHRGDMVTVWPFEMAKINFIYPIRPWSEK
ncbi:MAG: amino acid ABC transporter substrate-binding protein [Deltaproteobacteria bacterium RBG_16_48_10]|nr:MAG: amino acid ABC transporter substrate-binding protein [Deltaproteobacteria bacterium RBG_16_48_10]